MNVIPFLRRNISKTKTKQIINPLKEISEGFFLFCFNF